MKYLIAFALIAAAAALPEPARLLAPAPVLNAPLVVPQEVMDEIALTVNVADAPEAPQVAEDTNAYAVNFVEEAANIEASPALEDVSAYAVNFVDEAVNAEASPALEAVEDASAYVVNVVDEVNAEAPAVKTNQDVSAFAVNFVDEAVNADAPVAVKILDMPLPESVVMPLGSLVAPSVDAVQVVDAADVDEETPIYMPIKQYPDPRWR